MEGLGGPACRWRPANYLVDCGQSKSFWNPGLFPDDGQVAQLTGGLRHAGAAGVPERGDLVGHPLYPGHRGGALAALDPATPGAGTGQTRIDGCPNNGPRPNLRRGALGALKGNRTRKMTRGPGVVAHLAEYGGLAARLALYPSESATRKVFAECRVPTR